MSRDELSSIKVEKSRPPTGNDTSTTMDDYLLKSGTLYLKLVLTFYIYPDERIALESKVLKQ